MTCQQCKKEYKSQRRFEDHLSKQHNQTFEEYLLILEGRLKAIDEQERTITPPRSSQREAVMEEPSPYALPPRFRQVIDEVLGKEFTGTVEVCDDVPAFRLVIIVPQKYSSLPPKDYKELGADYRTSRPINNSMGLSGVREWCEKIRQQLRMGMNQFQQPQMMANAQSPFNVPAPSAPAMPRQRVMDDSDDSVTGFSSNVGLSIS